MNDGTHFAALGGFLIGVIFTLGIVCLIQFLGEEYTSFPIRAAVVFFD